MNDKFLGVGLINAFGLWCLFIAFTLMAKVIVTKYPVTGLSEVVLAGS